jgi:hypothetical protein
MNVNTTVAGLRDSITGSSEWWYSPEEWLHSPASQWIRIRPENIESLVARLMYTVGALPNPFTYLQLLVLFAQ